MITIGSKERDIGVSIDLLLPFPTLSILAGDILSMIKAGFEVFCPVLFEHEKYVFGNSDPEKST